MNFKTHIIDTNEKLVRLFKYEKTVTTDVFVYDLETDSEIERKANLYGIGICFDKFNSFYIPWRNRPETLVDKGKLVWDYDSRQNIIRWIERLSSSRKFVGHNIIYDVLVTKYCLNIDLINNIYADTILMKHAIDEDRPHGLKEIAVKYLGEWADSAQQDLKEEVLSLGGSWSKTEKNMYLASTATLGKYCCFDVSLTYLLFRLFSVKLKEEKLEKLFYEDETMPLYKLCTIPMKDKGFPVDIEYFKSLEHDITDDINKVELVLRNSIQKYISDFEIDLLNKNVPIKKNGNFPCKYAELKNIPLPKNKADKITLAKEAIKKQKEKYPEFSSFYDFVLEGENKLDPVVAQEARKWLLLNKKSKDKPSRWERGDREIFNLNSGDHLGYLFFDKLGLTPIKYSEKTGKPSTDKDTIEELITKYSKRYSFFPTMIEYRQLKKLLSTYIKGILSRHIDGIIYADMLQFGTTSGRYSCRNPNLTNLPRIKDEESGLSPLVLKYVNSIRAGFIAGDGKKISNADYSSLEPVCFAHMSNSEDIRKIFIKGYDLYSAVAIDVNNLHNQYSADKKADNYLKKHRPELRQLWKVPTLGIVYGMKESRLVESIGCTYEEAKEIINGYLGKYKDLKEYMVVCDLEATKQGYITTSFGRKRHLSRAKELHSKYNSRKLLNYKWAKERNLLKERRELKNLLNNAKNFKIQGLAAHIVNRAMIAIVKEFRKNNIDAYIALQVHDEITVICPEESSNQVLNIMKQCMENTTKISVPLKAEPLIADRWSDAK